jgi:hypothetical protein
MKPQSDRLRERGGGVHGGRCLVCAPTSGRRVDAGRRMASLSTARHAALLIARAPDPKRWCSLRHLLSVYQRTDQEHRAASTTFQIRGEVSMNSLFERGKEIVAHGMQTSDTRAWSTSSSVKSPSSRAAAWSAQVSE